MFGGDSKPNAKDTVLKGDINYLDAEYDGDYDDYNQDDVYYQDAEAYTTTLNGTTPSMRWSRVH